MSQNVYANMLRVLSCVLLSGKVKLFLEVDMKRERERVSVCAVSGRREYIGNPCHVVGPKRCENKSRYFPD